MNAGDELIDRYVAFLVDNMGRSDSTGVKYGGYLRRLVVFLVPREGDLLTVDIDLLEEFTGIFLIRAGLTPAGRKPVITCMRSFFKWALRANIRPDNPALLLMLPKVPPHYPSVMQLRDAERLLRQPDLNTLQGVRDAAMIATLIGCGFRLNGMLGLNESSLIFTNDENGREVLLIRVMEKGKKERVVPAPDETRLLIRAYLGHPDLAEVIRDLDNGDKVLFVSFNNMCIAPHRYYGEERRMKASSTDRMIKKYGKMCDIDPKVVHAHSFRHLYATELVEADVSVLHMKALLGHSKTDTLDIYNHTALRKLTKESQRGNPLGKINTPVSQLLKELNK